jgi:ABC-type transport system substrate-binding protein
MLEHDRVAPRRGPGPAGRGIGSRCLAAIGVAAMLAAGCGSAASPSPTATASQAVAPPPASTGATPQAAAVPSSSPTPARADTLRIGWNPASAAAIYGFRGATESPSPHQITLGSVVYDGLYRYDARFGAIPDLADGPCLPQGDGTVIRCRFIETTFHDGTPLTADDVAYTYRLFSRPTFSGGPTSGSWTGSLKDVRVVDPRTVDFELTSVDPTFMTTVLPVVPILPRHAVEASHAAFVAATKDLKAADLVQLADTIDAETSKDPPVCTPRIESAATVLATIGVPLYREDWSRAGTFDACDWGANASWFVRQAATAMGATGLDAVATAYAVLSIDRRPVGTGPYRLVSEDADEIHLEAWPGYHGGRAATRYLDFVPAKGDGSDLLDGSIDIYQTGNSESVGNPGPAFRATAAAHGVRVATLPENGYYALQFNVRPGRLFADLALREALQLCIDLPRDVDAATGDAATPVYGPVTPGTWAYDSSLPRPARDTAAARRLIEGAGWKAGADGVYARDGERLAADIVVRGDAADRVKMTDLIVAQARDCGMDLRSRPTGWEELTEMLSAYPHDIPGTKTPFDLYLGGWMGNADPNDALGTFVASAISDATHPDGSNYVGFTDPVIDRLVAAGKATYDQEARASLYRQAQQELAAQLPYLFLWAANGYDIVRSAVTTVDGPVNLTTPDWAWQPERLVVEEAVQ